MLNNRTLYPPLFKPVSSGGGGSGQTIQVTELPEAVLSEKDKIYQYIGNTTETLTNGFFYKCVELTGYDWEETEASETYTEAEALPTASAETVGTIYKVDDKYYQTVIVLTYSWENIPVMEVESGGGVTFSTTETVIGTYDGKPLYGKILRGLTSGWNSGNAFKIPIAKLVYGDYQINTGNGAMVGAFSSGDYKISTIQFSDTDGIYISLSGSNWTLGDVIIAYTKTTD